MQQLMNNCRAGKMNVFPSDWETDQANPNCKWYISYRFYDDNLKQSKLIIIKGMNRYVALKDKQNDVKSTLAQEIGVLQKGCNPITKYIPSESDKEVDSYTGFIQALEYALEKKITTYNTKKDIKGTLKFFSEAAKRLDYAKILIKDITRRHIKLTLEECGKNKSSWSGRMFNHYRKYISLLFKELLELDIVESNPVRDISKQKYLVKVRRTLTKEERKEINDFLFHKHYSFWRFLQIFFHSSSRITELMNLKKEDIDMENQRFLIVMKKGANYTQVWRTIKTIALPFWKEIYAKAKKDQYLFSDGLLPGDKAIRPDQITKRWYRLIKKKKDWNITADFYSLKHSNLDEVSELMGLQAAQKMAGHSSPAVTRIYAVNERDREHTRLVNLENSFA